MIELITNLLISLVSFPIEMLIGILGLKGAVLVCASFIISLGIKGIMTLI